MPCSVVPCDGGGCEALCASAAGLNHVRRPLRSLFLNMFEALFTLSNSSFLCLSRHLEVPHLKHCGLFTKFRSRPRYKTRTSTLKAATGGTLPISAPILISTHF